MLLSKFCCRWLDVLLSRIILQAKAFVSSKREVFFKIMGKILKRLVDIDHLQSQVMKELERDLNTRIDGAITELSKYLSTEEVKKRFTSWTLDDAPKVESSWEATENQIRKVLLARILDIIEQWEENKQVFSNARNSLLKHSQEHYNFVEEQLRNLHNDVVDNVGGTQTSSTESSLTVGTKFAIGVTSPIWVPLGLVALIIGAPILGIMATKEMLEDRRTMKTYEEYKCAFMAEVSAEYLDNINNDRALRPFVEEQLQEAKLCLQNTKVRISELIRADKMLCEQLYNETRGKREIIKLYRPMLDDATEFRGKLAVFGFKDVFGEDVNEKTLDWKEDASHLLGSGASGLVYKGTMTKDQHARPVALKVYREALKPTNACEIMAEVELLR